MLKDQAPTVLVHLESDGGARFPFSKVTLSGEKYNQNWDEGSREPNCPRETLKSQARKVNNIIIYLTYTYMYNQTGYTRTSTHVHTLRHDLKAWKYQLVSLHIKHLSIGCGINTHVQHSNPFDEQIKNVAISQQLSYTHNYSIAT